MKLPQSTPREIAVTDMQTSKEDSPYNNV